MEGSNGAAVLDPDPQDVHEGDGFRPGELLIEGTAAQLTLDVGGAKKPTTSTLRLVGGKIEVEGQFKKGDTVAVRIEAVVNEVAFKDEHDSATGQVIGCGRNHRARIVAVHVED